MSATETERRPATPEEIWEILRQVAIRQKEGEEALKEARKERRELREQMEETDRRLRRAEGLFTSQWGRLMESLVEGDLVKLLRERNVEVDVVSSRIRLSRDPKQREVDLFAANGEEAVAVEVKSTLKPEHVTDFLELLDELPNLFRGYRARRLYGAVAYLKAHE